MNIRKLPASLLLAAFFVLPAHSQILRLPRFITVQAQAPAGQTEAKPDHHITAEEQNELLASIDSILKFDAADTDLPQKQSIKKQFVTRDQVQAFVEKRMKDDQDAQRLQRSEVVLKKFGLLPADFKLQEFLVELLREQVAGYYDPDTKTVYLLDWLEPEQQKPVMAHELTHALQDQNFGLKKWLRDDPKDHDSAQAEVSSDEQSAARSAVVEGQAMAVMLDYLLEPAGQSVLQAPRIVDAIEAGMETGNGTPVFSGAPLYLKQLLLFPYTYGLDFTRDLLQRGGKKRAFADVFKKPPMNTRQIMQPASYVQEEKAADMRVPELSKALGDKYERYDVGSIGQFDVNILIRTYGKKGENDKLAESWRGGWYYAVKPKSDATSDIGLVYVSRWADEAAARQFAAIYAGYLPSRYPGVTAAGDNNWQTSQGPASIQQQGASVVVMESLDAGAAARVREAVDKSLSGK
ncbi:MAG TPA: hypothetical protein VFU76_07465 [Terriglobales bacterium]|nr:hypothetical protein [Terriglobales bacterium]